MGARYRCRDAGRRAAVLAQEEINGIDYLEVGAGQTILEVVFLHGLPGSAEPVPPAGTPLAPDDLVIDGGVRVRGIRVEAVAVSGNRLTVTVDRAGDYSPYVLRLVAPGADQPPAGFDPRLSEVPFSFKVDCASGFDCLVHEVCPPAVFPEPEIDYLAKDYESFRRLMLDRLSMLLPEWRERSPADLQVALVELLAHAGDQLSYFQDAVATEAYLGTARKRTSVRRHARLLDYRMHEGCNARAWVAIDVEGEVTLKGPEADTPTTLLTRGIDPSPLVPPELPDAALAERPVIFEVMHPATLRPARNRIDFHTWSDRACCLPRGATEATLVNEDPLGLSPGDVLIFEEVRSPTTGDEADADPTHRHAVRLTAVRETHDEIEDVDVVDVAWDVRDAVPFPLCLTAVVEVEGGGTDLVVCSVALGNVVLADHGRTITGAQELLPGQAPEAEAYRPRLARGPVTFADPVDLTAPATVALMERDPRGALPGVEVTADVDGEAVRWPPRHDLLASGRFDQGFVVEMEDGEARLRFGDGLNGRRPPAGAVFTARYRVGNGTAGNVGAGAITRIGFSGTGITAVRNPLPATGGTGPEGMEEVRQLAPEAFRTQERAVTEEDWAAAAQRHPEIQRAAATFRWTGTWHTVFVTVDRRGGREVDPEFEAELLPFLDRFRLAGYDLEVDGPVPVPLDVALAVCVDQGAFRSDILRDLLDAFSAGELPGGRRGFFHPDNFTFGQPLYLSQIFEAALRVPGVATVEAERFQRWGKAPNLELEDGVLRPGRLEVVRLDNDPNFPELGRIEFKMAGGL